MLIAQGDHLTLGTSLGDFLFAGGQVRLQFAQVGVAHKTQVVSFHLLKTIFFIFPCWL